MRRMPASLVLISLLSGLACAADSDPFAEPVIERIVLKDGQHVTGQYDAAAGQIILTDAEGHRRGTMGVAGADIVSHTPIHHRLPHPAMAVATPSPPGSDGIWIESYDEAKKAAMALHRPILIEFTGSDWCVWCKRLDSEVFDNDAFHAWAKERVVLLRCDFPQQRELDQATRQQNDDLAATWHVEGYPTVLLVSATGDKLAQSGYRQGGPQAWIADLEGQQRTHH